MEREKIKHQSIFEEKESKTGPIIGSIIIIVIILIGGLFFLNKMIQERKQEIEIEKNQINNSDDTQNFEETLVEDIDESNSTSTEKDSE